MGGIIRMKMKAKMFATMAHKNQRRKLTNEPYISHPIRVAKQLEKCQLPEELICAGYLHDVVEDTPINMEDIEQHFGKRVANIVAAHTEDKSKSWKERKQETIEAVKAGSKEVKYLIVADKLDNLLDVQALQSSMGDDVWKEFRANKEEQQWYNEAIVEHMYEGLEEKDIPAFFHTYEHVVQEVFH